MCLACYFFFQAEDGIRDYDMWLEFRRVLFRSLLVVWERKLGCWWAWKPWYPWWIYKRWTGSWWNEGWKGWNGKLSLYDDKYMQHIQHILVLESRDMLFWKLWCMYSKQILLKLFCLPILHIDPFSIRVRPSSQLTTVSIYCIYFCFCIWKNLVK